MRGLPFPGWRSLADPASWAIYLPLVAVGLAAVELVRHRAGAWRLATDRPVDRLVLILALLSCCFYYKGLVRVSTTHMLLAIVPATLLLGVVAERYRAGVAGVRLLRIAAFALAAIPPVALAAGELAAAAADPQRVLAGSVLLPRKELGSGCVPPDDLAPARIAGDYLAVSRYVRLFSAPDERIFVGLHRHDRMIMNPMVVYLAASRLPGTHWYHFDPGLQSRSDIQQRIVHDLTAHRIRWVVRDASFDLLPREPNQSYISSGVHLLDRWLAAHYRPVARSGRVSVWLRDDVRAPAMPARSPCMPAAV